MVGPTLSSLRRLTDKQCTAGLAVITARVYPDERISSKAPAATLFTTSAPAGTELHQFIAYELSGMYVLPITNISPITHYSLVQF